MNRARSPAAPARRSKCNGPIPVGRSNRRRPGGRPRSRQLRDSGERIRSGSPPSAGWGSPARCTARLYSTPETGRCARPSSGTTHAPASSARSSSPRSLRLTPSPATSPCPASRRRSSSGWRSTSRRCSRASPPSCFQGLPAPAPHRREGVGHVRRGGTLWLDVARRDWSDVMLEGAGSPAPTCRGSSKAAPRADACSRTSRRAGASGTSHRGRRGRRQCGERGRYRCDAPGDGFVSLGTSGVLFVVNDRFSPNQRAPSTPSAMLFLGAGTR